MSFSVGTTSNALTSLQAFLQKGVVALGNAANASDPLSVLFNTLSASNKTPASTSSSAATPASGSSAAPFGTDAMATLLTAQDQATNTGQSANGQKCTLSHTGGAGGSSGSGGDDSLLSSTTADGATTVTVTNPDGSTTTTTTYADGSTVEATTPAAAASPSGAGTTGNATQGKNSSANLFDQLMQMQSQLLKGAASTLSAFA